MNHEDLTPDELAAAKAELLREEEQVLNARAVERAEQRRAERAARQEQAERRAVVIAAEHPSSDEDRMVVASGSSAARSIEDIQLHPHRYGHWLTADQAAGVVAAGRAGEGWAVFHRAERCTRELMICAKRLPDLRAMLAAAFADNETHGDRPQFMIDDDASRIDDLVIAIVGETTHVPLLEDWLQGASSEHDRNLITARLSNVRSQRGAR